MAKLFRSLVLLLANLLAVSMLVGCGGDDIGTELVNETVYVIAGRISKSDGTQTDIKITFVTKGKA